jgi:hypothetical protein
MSKNKKGKKVIKYSKNSLVLLKILVKYNIVAVCNCTTKNKNKFIYFELIKPINFVITKRISLSKQEIGEI